ncbi:MAG: DinB family protein [Pyrinomonadaceae bacterium]|nr:DinB family protein [Pyrinomonadaceae bacterium]
MKFQIEKAVEILSQTPVVVKSLLGNLSDDWVKNESNSENWSAFDVVGHLIQGEETNWIPRAEIILAESKNPAFEPFDRFAQLEKSKGKTLNELLETFAAARAKSLDALREMNLTEEKLQLKGIHPELGEVTLEQLLATWTVHDLTHIKQIVTVLANKYAENVGVWKQYLSILE